ncbi:MAG: enoyl-CoA hydratase/isomerase family protein [Alphaproteobacteria bacterium]|nr:enoyl-CoA hydratase/isomerase family protein [Alphaproteobacteria bacterium]
MASQLIQCERRGSVAVIWLNRPAKRNALTTAMMWRLGDLVRELGRDRRARVIVIAGKGPHFSAGGDMGEMLGFSALDADRSISAWQDNLEIIERSPKPVIAAVHGAAFGGGTELAIACHIRVCADDARFAQTEIALDHLPGGGGTQRLPRLIALGAAYEHLLLGQPIPAADAYRLGLVNHVWPRDELMERTMALAQRIARRAPTAVRYTMEAVRAGLMAPLEVGMRMERAMAALVGDSRPARKGLEEFFGKGRRAEAKPRPVRKARRRKLR